MLFPNLSMPLGNSGQRCCQGCGCIKQLCLLFPGSLPLQDLVQSCPSQPFLHLKPHNSMAECTTQDSILLLTTADQEMEESGLLLWGNVSQNSPVKHFHCLVLKINKKSTPIINNLVENRPHLLTCHILCSRILYLQVSIPSLSKESIPNKKMLQSWRVLD